MYILYTHTHTTVTKHPTVTSPAANKAIYLYTLYGQYLIIYDAIETRAIFTSKNDWIAHAHEQTYPQSCMHASNSRQTPSVFV